MSLSIDIKVFPDLIPVRGAGLLFEVEIELSRDVYLAACWQTVFRNHPEGKTSYSHKLHMRYI